MLTHRPLGSTGIMVSPLGLGTVKFGRTQGLKYPSAFELPDDKTVLELLAIAHDNGMNLIDTAPAYGSSETRLGQLLTNRKEWVISTKVGETFEHGTSTFDFTKQHTRMSVERSLKRLGTDYLDIVLVHANGDDQAVIDNTDVIPTLQALQQAGVIRAIGMSSKTVDGGLQALTYCDVVMVAYNPLDTLQLPVIQAANAANKGILIKKALASGHVDKLKHHNPVAHSLQFCLKEPGVSSVIVGTANPEHLLEAVHCIKDA